MIKPILTSSICLECQGCCRFASAQSPWSPFLLTQDLRELLDQGIPPSLVTPENKIRLMPDPRQGNFLCPFLDPGSQKCKVYAFRPFECRLYPFLIRRKGKKIFLACDLRCPFAQDNQKSPLFKEYTQYLKDFVNSPEFLSLLSAHPGLAGRYDGILDLAEIKI